MMILEKTLLDVSRGQVKKLVYNKQLCFFRNYIYVIQLLKVTYDNSVNNQLLNRDTHYYVEYK